jgi:hypothetical protein
VRALLIYQDPELPSSRIRILQLAPHLESRGITCELIRWPDRLSDKLRLRASLAQYDVVVLQKKLLTLLDAQLLSSARLIFDFDDAIMFRDRPKHGTYDSRARRIRFNRMVKKSRGMVAGNRYLADQAAHPRILIAPSPVPDQVPQRQHSEREPLRVGWVGLGRNLAALDPLRPAFEALAGRIELVIISNERYAGFPNEHVPWSLAEQDARVAELDAGIMPLAGDSPFTRGKCSYKLLQYMAAGLPCVASPVGMNCEVIDPSNGFLASTTEEWIDALQRLTQVELRARLGAAGRRKIEAEHTYDVFADRWAEFLKRVHRES